MILSRKAKAAYVSRDFDSFLWMKKLTRRDLLAEINALRVRPEFKTDPWLHQLVCFYIGVCVPRFLFLLDMGLGKSKIALDLMTQAQREKRLRRALVCVPRLINLESWRDDILKHSHLEPWLVSVENVEAKRERLLSPGGDLTVIDYQGLQWALCDKKKDKKGIQLVRNEKLVAMARKLYNFTVLDESHKLKNHEGLWFNLVDKLTSQMDSCYAMTGTLFGRDVEDVWSQFYLVDQGETFGENLGLFRSTFFTAKATPWSMGKEYTYDKRQTRQLNKMLQHRSIRYDDDEISEIELPRKMPPIVARLDMAEDQREHYLRAVEGVINAGANRQDLDAPWIRMRQITSGYLKWSDGHGDHLVKFAHNPKLDALERLIDEMGTSKLVVVYSYTDTGSIICERLKKLKIDHEWFYGGTKDKSGSRRRFMEDPACRVFVMNAEAGGTGNDGLQRVSRYMVFFESPGVTTRAQTEKRIHRAGQKERTYFYDLVMRGTVDQGILRSLAEDRDLYDSVIRTSGADRKKMLLGG